MGPCISSHNCPLPYHICLHTHFVQKTTVKLKKKHISSGGRGGVPFKCQYTPFLPHCPHLIFHVILLLGYLSIMLKIILIFTDSFKSLQLTFLSFLSMPNTISFCMIAKTQIRPSLDGTRTDSLLIRSQTRCHCATRDRC